MHAKRRISKGFFVFFFYCAAVLMLAIFAVYALDIANWKDLSKDSITNLAQSLRVYDRDGSLLSVLDNGQKRTHVSLSDLPQYVIDAFLCAEDVRFYQHGGIDVKRLFSALLRDLLAGEFKEGASTITQQLIKNSHLTAEKSLSRKAQEAVLALQLEAICSKDEILEMYLNYIYFGNHAYGIGAASQSYFSKPAAELTLAEAAMLAGLIRSPSAYAPHVHPERALSRRGVVLDLMLQNGRISRRQYEEATACKMVLNLDHSEDYVYGYYMDEILRSGCALLNLELEELLGGGYSIYTNMDSDLQIWLQGLAETREFFPEDTDTLPQCAIAVVESQTNRVLALCGGREHENRLCFNRAVQMRRAPGSAVKPLLVYGPAIELGAVNAATVFYDEPKSFDGFTPHNFANRYYGLLTVRDALVKSVNTTAVEILQQIGVETGKSFGRQLGLEFDPRDTGLTLALGGFTRGVSPLQMACAYSTLANGGTYSPASLIHRIEDINGRVVYAAQPESRRVFSPECAFIVSDILRQAGRRNNSCFSDLSELNIGVKTGTVHHEASGGNSDAWLCSCSRDFSVAVWIGYDRTTPEQALPSQVTGSTYPARIASAIFRRLYRDRPTPTVDPPAGILRLSLDKTTLLETGDQELSTAYTPRAATLQEYFFAASCPTQPSRLYSPPPTAQNLSVTLNGLGQPVIAFDCPAAQTRCSVYRMGSFCTCIGTIPGKTGRLSLTDHQAERGRENRYFVVVENPLALSNGFPLSSPASARVGIFVPD